MRPAFAVPAFSLLLWAAASRAAEGPGDVETDHLDAYDDGGKPSFGLFANAGALLAGAVAGRAEIALGDAAALALEGDYFALGAARAYGASLGTPLFVERVRFHGLYVEPRLAASVPSGASVGSAVFGLGATAGWEETWRFGLSLKGGIGLMYATTFPGEASSPVFLGIRPLVDAAAGWVF
jgi:hypothetical protein